MTVSKPDVVPRVVPRHVSSVPIPIVDALEKLLEIENINCVYFRGHRAFESLEWAYGELQSRTKFQTCEIRLIRKAFQFDTAMIRINSNADRIEHVEFAAWNDDELIEYLLAKYPTQCKRVMAKIASEVGRVRNADSRNWIHTICEIASFDRPTYRWPLCIVANSRTCASNNAVFIEPSSRNAR